MNKTRTVKINMLFIGVVIVFFCFIIIKLSYVSLSNVVNKKDLKAFASSRNTAKETLIASRGSIYDKTGEILARNVNSYTVIAYLEPTRTTDNSNPQHVVDKELTASTLSPLINMTKEKIMEMLKSSAYQVELGPGGRGITELLKEEIESKDLPGISFTKSIKRYYPKSDFLSYTLGYAKTDEKTEIDGEMGIELFYNDKLSGTNGYKEYQQDMFGYQIASTKPIIKKAIDGNNIYLTIDTNIQMFVEQEMEFLERTKMDWANITVMNAKTGEILGSASSPSFNPNTKNISSYYDPFVSFTYEPGSTMKMFSFLAAMENKLYDGKELYTSGSIKIDKYTIEDWNKKGWGDITYDEGFAGSSNVAAAKLSQKLGKEKLREFYEKLGFGYKTGITLPNEQEGNISFKYEVETANAAFGQGLTITPVQMMQAASCIANDGDVIKPYIVDKITDDKGKVIFTGKKEILNKAASKENTDYMKRLMKTVVDGSVKTAYAMNYNVPEFDLIGKTGTAEIAGTSGSYLTGTYNYIRSFTGMFPGNNPEIIFYIVVSKPTNLTAVPTVTKSLVKSIGTYLNLNSSITKNTPDKKVLSYINKETNWVKEELINKELNPIIIGNGDKIIQQYPNKGAVLNKNDKVFLLTSSSEYKYIDILSWSKKDVSSLFKLMDMTYEEEGYGYVTSYSYKLDDVINKEDKIKIIYKPLYEIKKESTN